METGAGSVETAGMAGETARLSGARPEEQRAGKQKDCQALGLKEQRGGKTENPDSGAISGATENEETTTEK